MKLLKDLITDRIARLGFKRTHANPTAKGYREFLTKTEVDGEALYVQWNDDERKASQQFGSWLKRLDKTLHCFRLVLRGLHLEIMCSHCRKPPEECVCAAGEKMSTEARVKDDLEERLAQADEALSAARAELSRAMGCFGPPPVEHFPVMATTGQMATKHGGAGSDKNSRRPARF